MTGFSAEDHRHMARALRLAEQGVWTTQPNPRVGCVLVNQGKVVGEGFHEYAGGAHAEINALTSAGPAARGATAYVTLEPCHHYGRTPPCRQALIDAEVGRVVAAMEDPFPAVSGQGIAALREAGIDTEVGLMAVEAGDLNVGFVSRFKRGRPYVRVKLAASLDGRTALVNGQSQWITGREARADVQRWRARACAILTGSGTVNADDPRLIARVPALDRQPLRVVLASDYAIRSEARIFAQPGAVLVIGSGTPPGSLSSVARCVSLGQGRSVDVSEVLSFLAGEEINEVHVEAGQTLCGALLQANLVDEVLLYVAPSILGHDAKGLFAMPTLESMTERINLEWIEARQIGRDLRVRLRPTDVTSS